VKQTLALFFLAHALVYAAAPSEPHVRNFGQVDEHLYRGGEPSLVALDELHAFGIKTVIDLRLPGEGSLVEKDRVLKLDMRYVSVPLPPFSAPSQAQIESILSMLLRNDSGPVFLHCHRGKDRTGTVVACYRIQHDNGTTGARSRKPSISA